MISIPFSRVKLNVAVEHENKKFKKGVAGLALLQPEFDKKGKVPVWLHDVRYPIYLKKTEFEITYLNPVGQQEKQQLKKRK